MHRRDTLARSFITDQEDMILGVSCVEEQSQLRQVVLALLPLRTNNKSEAGLCQPAVTQGKQAHCNESGAGVLSPFWDQTGLPCNTTLA